MGWQDDGTGVDLSVSRRNAANIMAAQHAALSGDTATVNSYLNNPYSGVTAEHLTPQALANEKYHIEHPTGNSLNLFKDMVVPGALLFGGGYLGAEALAGLGASGGAAGAVGDAAIAGGAGTDAMVGGATAGAGGTAAAGGAAATGLTDIGGGMSVDAAGNVVTAGAAGGTAGAGGVDLGGGMTADQFGNVSGAAATGGILGGINPQLLGAGAGALLGGVAGGSKPAGTTTTTSDVPAWLMPYLTGNLNAAQGVRDSLAGNPTTTSAATPEYLKTINGDYLDPASNPYLDATYKHAAGLVGAGVDSRFEASNRYGSGAHQGVLQEGFNNLANNIYGGNYQTERARQVAAVTGAPSFDTGTATAAYAPYSGFNSLFPGNSRSTTTPYFTNQAGGILGGALAGSQLSRMFG